MNDAYDVIYTGKLLHGFEVNDVAERFKSFANVDQKSACKFILRSGKVFVKKNVSKEIALKYQEKLTKIGLEINICPRYTSEIIVSERIEPCINNINVFGTDKNNQKQNVDPNEVKHVIANGTVRQYFSKAPYRILLSLIISITISYLFNLINTGKNTLILIVLLALIVYGYLSVFLIQNRNKLLKSIIIMACCYIVTILFVLFTGGWITIGHYVAIVTTSLISIICKSHYIEPNESVKKK